VSTIARGVHTIRREQDALHDRLINLEVDAIMDGRERVLRAAYEQGVELDVGEELIRTATLSDADFDRSVKRMRANYARDPRRSAAYERQSTQAAEVPLDRKARDAVIRFAQANGVNFSEARKRVFPNRQTVRAFYEKGGCPGTTKDYAKALSEPEQVYDPMCPMTMKRIVTHAEKNGLTFEAAREQLFGGAAGAAENMGIRPGATTLHVLQGGSPYGGALYG
jgi:hypothetical protein